MQPARRPRADTSAATIPPEHAAQPRRALAGALWVVFAVTIWAGWMVTTRLGVATAGPTRLSAWDITALRFLVAGLLLAPVVLRRGFAWRKLGGPWFAVLVAGAGAPYVVVVTWALIFAPAAHGGALLPGTMPLFVAVLAFALLRERMQWDRLAGLSLTVSGIAVLLGNEVLRPGSGGGDAVAGDLLFLLAAFMWACSTLAMKRGGLAPLHGTAVVAVTSLLLYLPPYLILTGRHVLSLPLAEAVFHGFYQGVMTSVVSLIAYMRGIALLGPARGSAFSALVPVMAALLGIPVLGEWPAPATWIAVALTASGVVLASGVARALAARR
ncbi:MAG: DMT family transporter [Alphaproteobacteria bacterium]|nr:DMT family transporter [Alphaproteobacteria bacterium]